jgi:hypothetical protein
MDLERAYGLTPAGEPTPGDRRRTIRIILFRLAAMGCALPDNAGDDEALSLVRDLVLRYREQSRLLPDHLPPADRRLQAFIAHYLHDLQADQVPRLPTGTFILDHHGVARELSFPVDADSFHNDYLSSYRTAGGGVLHNASGERRSPRATFQIADGGLPVPTDKAAVPLPVFANLLREALRPPPDLLRLPFTAAWPRPVELMASLLIRPLVCPAVPGLSAGKRMEVRCFAPGGLISNLDFIESVFGNSGDPYLAENDAAQDVVHWTGHSGCVIIAPHLTRLRKKDLGLPHVGQVSPAQRATGLYWTAEHELYNDGKPFKITARDLDGVMITLLTDNHFGSCAEEVKTQISFAANLFGLAEEEQASAALVFPTVSSGDSFSPDGRVLAGGHRFVEVLELLGETVELHPAGHATDRHHPTVHYLPEDMEIDLPRQDISWTCKGEQQHLALQPGHVYVHPSGYKVRMEKHPAAPSWRLVRTGPEGTLCHRMSTQTSTPASTLSGGDRSRIGESPEGTILYGPVHVKSFAEDMARVEEIFARDYRDRWLPGRGPSERLSRPALSPRRSLGSVIKLLTPNDADCTPEHNAWLRSIPNHVKALAFVIKRFHQPDWQGWREHFSVDIIDGQPGHELKLDGRRLVGSYLRAGFEPDGAFRTFKVRQDFVLADKVSLADDVTASVVVPASRLTGLPPDSAAAGAGASVKLVASCELRLFQRPDDAIGPGVDRQAEADLVGPGVFAANFQPLRPREVQQIIEDVALFERFTPPMQAHLQRAAAAGDAHTVCSARPLLVAGKLAPTRNPRYLQTRADVGRPRDRHLAEMGARLQRRISLERPVVFPVQEVLLGRRAHPPGDGVRPLCMYGPIHYQELPELFMDHIASLTGEGSPDGGLRSEGALSKGPVNALCATADLNNALVAMILCGHAGFSITAGWIGPHHRCDHDLTQLVPELWCRLTPEERDPRRLIAEGGLEKLDDYELDGRTVKASRLGYRITARFVRTHFGKIFDQPAAMFPEEILKPERQDPRVYAEGIESLVEVQHRVARAYFEDGSIEDASPPLRALLHIMTHGHWEDKTAAHPELRALFSRESLLSSRWYRERLAVKQSRDVALWQRHVRALAEVSHAKRRDDAEQLAMQARLDLARQELERVKSRGYLAELQGTIGADPIHRAREVMRLGEVHGGESESSPVSPVSVVR